MNSGVMLAVGSLFFVAPSAALAQDTFIYNLGLEVIENEVIDNGTGGDLSTLPVGTTGLLQIELNSTTTHYPGFSVPGETVVYDIQSIGLSIGGVSAAGASGTYPSSAGPTGMLMQNDGYSNFPQDIRMDFFGNVLNWDHPEFAFSSLIVNEEGDPGIAPTLFGDVDLPSVVNILQADKHEMGIMSAIDGSTVVFEIVSMEGSIAPAAPTGAVAALGMIGLARRRRAE
ncbi:MAG: hypothetical protein Phyf2KO_18370 [Phycisphaerales bacterium]